MKGKVGIDEAVLTRMLPYEASLKNDILLGWFENTAKSISGPYDDRDWDFANMKRFDDCNLDIKMMMLIGTKNKLIL